MRARNRLALVAAGAFCLIASVYATATRRSAVEVRVRDLLVDALRAPCAFDEAEFTFLDGLTIRGLRVFARDDPLQPPLVQVGTARLDFNLDLFGQGPRLTVVHLQSPTVRLSAGQDGRASLLDIAAPSAPGSPAPALPTLRILDGTVIVDGPPMLPAGDVLTLRSIKADVVADEEGIRVPDGHARTDSLGAIGFTFDLASDGTSLRASIATEEIDIGHFVENTGLAQIRQSLARLGATGKMRVRADASVVSGAVTRLDADVEVSGARVETAIPDDPGAPSPEPFAIEFDQLHVTLSNGRVTIERGAGRVLGAALQIHGHADLGRQLGFGADVPPALDLAVTLTDVAITKEFRRHLPEHLLDISETYALEGFADVRASVRGPLADPDTDVHLDARDVTASYVGPRDENDPATRSGFPWRVDGLVGTVDVLPGRIAFQGSGHHGDASVDVDGYNQSLGDAGSRTEVRVTATRIPIDQDLWAGFEGRGEETLGPWRPEGVAEAVEVLVEQSPDVAAGETGTQVTIRLGGDVAFTPSVLPARMQAEAGVIRILEPPEEHGRGSRVEIEGVRARAPGFTLVSADGAVVGGDEDLHVVFAVESLEASFRDAVLASSTLSDGAKHAVDLLRPSGAAEVDILIKSTAGARDDVVAATLNGVDVRGWEGVPLSLSGLVGAVRFEDDTLTTPGLHGVAFDDATISVSGALSDISGTIRPRVDLRAQRLPLDTRLRDALGTLVEGVRGVWDEIPPAADLHADVSASIRPPDDPDGELRFSLAAVRGGLTLLGLPLQLQSGDASYDAGIVSGSLDALRGAGSIHVDRFTYDSATGDVAADLSARGLLFPDDLVPLLAPEAAATIAQTLSPAHLHLPRLHVAWDDTLRQLDASGAASFRVTAQGLEQEGIHVRAQLELDDVVAVFPTQGPTTVSGHARLTETSVDPGVTIEDLRGGATFRGELGGDPSTFELDLTDASARLFGLRLDELATRLEIEGELLRLPSVRANLYDGVLEGHFNKGGERLAYRGSFDLTGADLALYAADQQLSAMAGTVDTEVRFRNPGGPAGELEGSGRLEVAGAAVRVPWISASLLAIDRALLGVSAIKGDFHTGRLAFDVRGRRLLVRELHFEGPSVPFFLGATLEIQDGQGVIDMIDGRIDLAIYPRVKLGVLGLDPTGIFDRIVGLAQFMVRRLRVEGTTRNPRTRWEVIARDIDEELRPHPRPLGDIRRFGPEPW